MAFGYNDPMPVDKLLRLFIIQAISSFVANDYESGIHYLKEIKQTYAEKMSQLNPTLKNMAKEIIQAVDMFNPDAFGTQLGGDFRSQEPPAQQAPAETDAQPQQHSPQDQTQPSSVTSELQELLRRRKEQRKNR